MISQFKINKALFEACEDEFKFQAAKDVTEVYPIREASKLMSEKEAPTKGRIAIDSDGVYIAGEPPHPFIPILNKKDLNKAP